MTDHHNDHTFVLPDLGEGLREAEIVSWHVGIGDHVVQDQPLVSVETDKAVVELPSPRSGHVAALHGEPGDIVQVGAPLLDFSDSAADRGAIVGEVPSAEDADPSGAGAEQPAAKKSPPTSRRARAAPAVRALARSLGVDLATLTPTGPGGSITSDDVRAVGGERAGVEDAGGDWTANADLVTGVRRAMVHNMVRAGREVVPATVMDEADIGDWPADTDVTARLIRAVVAGCRASPSLNAWFDAGSMKRQLHERVDLGIAMETGDGLFAPVLRDVGNRDPADIRGGLDAMKRDVDARAVSLEQLTGQTITLSNFGMVGGRFADLVVLPPQVAILGAGRAVDRVRAIDGAAVVRRILPLSLTFDHRAVTGVEAARMLMAVIDDLQQTN